MKLIFRNLVEIYPPFIYRILYYCISIDTVVLGLNASLIHNLFFSCGLNISAHFKLLKHQFRAVEIKSLDDIKCLARKHEEILKFCRKLNQIYGPLLLFNFIYPSTMICVLGFRIATVGIWMVFWILPT